MVTIDEDWHVGHDTGTLLELGDADAISELLREVESFTGPPWKALVRARASMAEGSGKRDVIQYTSRTPAHRQITGRLRWKAQNLTVRRESKPPPRNPHVGRTRNRPTRNSTPATTSGAGIPFDNQLVPTKTLVTASRV